MFRLPQPESINSARMFYITQKRKNTFGRTELRLQKKELLQVKLREQLYENSLTPYK